ncbi:Phosphodiesterase/alkaline phosphatase D [Fulvivirga imtechensis AK7]|uniref:Phosphodiesterase/alkaline phosphatase D n=1 Tax=Fulvivirga imtechensis AK7 TaxID=1237149 RepID=L8JVP0_9BACT|nr:alkaline phosphatase D family protein [Fulvivirga imtechensis]ELR72870.1 Phosphodiesterase/alkaline phosphatase D [Fulvivirga imtechensis AK7]
MKYPLALLLLTVYLISCESARQNESESHSRSGIAQYFENSLKPFYHGVASGDPLSDRVIIWTRVTPEEQVQSLEVVWEVAANESFGEIINSGQTTTGPGNDYTVKIDVDRLSPNTRYFYRFKALGVVSPIGSTKTVPETMVDSLKFAVASCSNYEWGYFNAYKNIAEREDLDAVLHLGDYIYEYPVGGYGDTTIGRKHFPPHEIVTLEDYRLRYSQYRLDPDLRAAHQNHPFITIWDDHEIANDSYSEGAQNHQPGEGDYDERKAAARKAYYEWLPVRPSNQLYRAFKYGNLAKLIMLDERLAGRTAPVDSVMDPEFESEARSMLGEEQMSWFTGQLKSADATWKVIGNQVIYSYLNWGHETFNINLDSWDGYPAEQQKIANFIKKNDIGNVIFVTGDTHSSWAFEVTVNPFSDYDPISGQGAFAVEFGTTSINSSNSNERFSTDSVLLHEKKIVNTPVNPHLKYANLRDHGYMVLSLFPDSARAQWFFVETLREPSSSEKLGMSVTVDKGSNKLKFN